MQTTNAMTTNAAVTDDDQDLLGPTYVNGRRGSH
jgi:hypothetical protein